MTENNAPRRKPAIIKKNPCLTFRASHKILRIEQLHLGTWPRYHVKGGHFLDGDPLVLHERREKQREKERERFSKKGSIMYIQYPSGFNYIKTHS